MKRGFTLVELSIVLVIIGLLIGGIIAAQSMIGTAKTQSLIRQLGQFYTALANFKTKFGQLLGDNNLIGASKGNNDHIIRAACTNINWGGETAKYWYDLQVSGFTAPNGITFEDDSTATIALVPSPTQLVTAAAGKKAHVLVYGYAPDTNFYVIGNFSPAPASCGGGVFSNNAFTPVEALAIDAKVDDGNPSAGNVLGTDISVYYMYYPLGSSQLSQGTGCTKTAAGSAYQSSSTIACQMIIRLGIAGGDLQ